MGMAQAGVLPAGAAPASWAARQAGQADRAIANNAGGHLILAKAAEGTLAIHALRCQAVCMGQVPVLTQRRVVRRLTATIAYKRLQAVEERIPNDGAGSGCTALADLNG